MECWRYNVFKAVTLGVAFCRFHYKPAVLKCRYRELTVNRSGCLYLAERDNSRDPEEKALLYGVELNTTQTALVKVCEACPIDP